MNDALRTDTYAAVDLGSNSFHLLVARREHGELRVIDHIKEMAKPKQWEFEINRDSLRGHIVSVTAKQKES